MKSNRVQIIGDHPHSGKYGVVLAISEPLHGVLPVMARIKLDDEPEECFAERKKNQMHSDTPKPPPLTQLTLRNE